MVIKRILYTQLVVGVVIFLHFFPLQFMGEIGQLVHSFIYLLAVGTVLLYLPGYWWSRVFFDEKELTEFERFICSFAISLGWVILLSFYLTLAGGTVDTYYGVLISSIGISLGVIISILKSPNIRK